LKLSLTKVTQAGLRELPPLKDLRDLALIGIKLSDEGLKDVVKHRSLKNLALSSISDKGVEQLAQLEELTDLFVGRPVLTDTGLLQLARLKKLKWLQFFERPKISEAAIKELQKALPEAYLGIPLNP